MGWVKGSGRNFKAISERDVGNFKAISETDVGLCERVGL